MSYILVNGEKINSDSLCISAFDRGFTLGHGLFETMLVNCGVSPLLHYHWQRLVTSADFLGISVPFDFNQLKRMTDDLILSNQFTQSKTALRLTLTDGISARSLIASDGQAPTYTLTTSLLADSKQAMTATLVNTRRNEHSLSSRIKSISYLDNILAKKEALSQGFDEAFLLNSKNYLAEGSISNVFVVKDHCVYTPSIEDGALPGVIRHIILHALHLDKIVIKEQSLDKEFLFKADEIFISNALLGVKPICQLNDVLYSSPFAVTEYISGVLKNSFGYF